MPVANCSAGCANADSVAWASTNLDDQKTLASYRAALDQDAKRGVAYIVGTPIMVGGAALGGLPMASQFIAGAAIGGGVNYAAQAQLNNGNVETSGVIMGAVTGGLTMGRSLIPTVLINTGGAFTTAAYENQNIEASVIGTAIGSALGWKFGNVTERIGGQIVRRSTSDFASDWISKPFAISAPVQANPWPARVGATGGALIQEVVGDKSKKLAEGQ